MYCLLDVFRLLTGIVHEQLGIEVVAGSKLQRLFAEELGNGIVELVSLAVCPFVDDVIEYGSCTITQQHGLRVAARLQPFHGIKQRMVSVGALKAAGHCRYINQEVGLYHHYAGLHLPPFSFLLPCTPFLNMIVEQVQLHSLAHNLCQVSMFRVVHLNLFPFGGFCPYGLRVESVHDAAYIAGVDGRKISL